MPIDDTTGARERRHVADAYGLALLALISSVLVLIAAGGSAHIALVLFAGGLQLLALALTFRVSGVSQRSFSVGVTTLMVLFLSATAAVLFGGTAGAVVGHLGWMLIVVGAMSVVAYRARTFNTVSLRLVLALLCGYILLGMLFALGYSLVETVTGAAFSDGPEGISGALYFSFITLATVGYGDLTPGIPVVRSMAVAEAIVGQLYLVSVVSLAVSRFGRERPRA